MNYVRFTCTFFVQVSFTISDRQMQLYDKKWFIPTGTMTVYAGGQQPNQAAKTSSNVLQGSFIVM